jgi:Zn-dependent protease
VQPEGLPVARLFGIEIRVSIAWVLLLAIVTLLGADRAGAAAPELAAVVQWIIGGFAAVVFLLSVLAHELAHALVARRRGVEPGPVVLGFVGGLAPLHVQGSTPRDELAIAVSGPALSIGLCAVSVTAGIALFTGSGAVAAVGAALLVVGALNGILALLSIIPGMPLDGGRIVRTLAWARTGDQRRASRITATVGRLTGWLLIALGALIALTVRPAEGLMVLSLGWFVGAGGRALDRRLTVDALLEGISVGSVMERDVPRVAPQLTLDTFAERYLATDGATSLPVVADDAVLGVLGVGRLRRIRRRAWATTRAADVMAAPPAAPFLDVADPLVDALEALQRTGLDGLAVMEAGELAGMLTRRVAADAIRSRLRTGNEATNA